MTTSHDRALTGPLEGRALTLDYGGQPIVDGLDLRIPAGAVTVLVGANGCGKSTLLKAFARLLRPRQGVVVLNGQDIRSKPTVQVARELAILPQTPVAPEGLTVQQLVRMGRYPHQGWLRQWTREDHDKVESVLAATGLAEFRDRPVDALSGGQRQRAWIAMTLAQDADILLLDEPTTYLDLAHQIDVLDMIDGLNASLGKTVVMVLHDLNLAARYGHHLVALRQGRVHAQGRPVDILNEALVQQVFGLACRIVPDPVYGSPLCIPLDRRQSARRSQAVPS
ncbi:ABC transporter ATP-binding protein [Achromobacter sp. GG226]|uniref:ABC transporter ATP-binding protein n=1 Tax=Verticiella alkaliphila TaxID=2779529 RepID=UPI001C0D154B|nr:ABC transporter ATP-binding protein [Verticiella sp. GG226]MBU4611568.1 ABC transporter ATP-binding protein [Verticiella sp. GG226]